MTRDFPLQLDENGKAIRFAWPGGYPVFHAGVNGTVYCAACADEALRRKPDPDEYIPDPPTMSDAHWEGEDLECDADLPGFSDCQGPIESAYGIPDED